MAAITFATMKARVALACGNMSTSDPWYGYVGDHINEAANAVVLLAMAGDRKNLNMFPELRNIRWEALTVAATGYVEKPDAALAIESVTYTKVTTAFDPSTDTEYPSIEEPDQQRFGYLDKTATGYPVRWTEGASSILLWPTPTTDFLTRVVLRGFRKEDALTGTSDTFRMNEVFHPVVVDKATELTMRRMGWHDEADKFQTSCEKRLTQTVNILGLQNKRNRSRITIAGAL